MSKWIKRIVEIVVILLCLLLVWRVWLIGDESFYSDYTPTAASAELYKNDGALKVQTHGSAEDISEGGYFSVYGIYYTPDTKELQITVRYNANSVEPLGDIMFLGYTVNTSGEPVETVTDDEGNDITEDTVGTQLYEGYPIVDIFTPNVYGEEKKLFYRYQKLIFSDVDITEHTNVVISLCTSDSIDTEEAVIVAHFAEQPFKNYKLSRGEKADLSAYKSEADS